MFLLTYLTCSAAFLFLNVYAQSPVLFSYTTPEAPKAPYSELSCHIFPPAIREICDVVRSKRNEICDNNNELNADECNMMNTLWECLVTIGSGYALTLKKSYSMEDDGDKNGDGNGDKERTDNIYNIYKKNLGGNGKRRSTRTKRIRRRRGKGRSSSRRR